MDILINFGVPPDLKRNSLERLDSNSDCSPLLLSSSLTDSSLSGSSLSFITSLSILFTSRKSEVLVVEDFVGVDELILGWDGVSLLLDIDVNGWVLNDDWNFLADLVFFDLPDGEFSNVGNFVWDLDLGGVMLPELNDVWLVNGDSEEGLVPLGLLEFALDGVWLLLVLSHGDLLGDDVWHLLDDGVVNSLGNFIWDGEFFLIWDLVVDGVWNLLGDNIWDFLLNGVWDLSAGDIWDLELNFEWNLSLNSVWDFSGDFIWLKGLNFVLFGNVVGSGDLVWDGGDVNDWNLLGDLVLLSHVFSDIVVVLIGGGVRGWVFSPLGPFASKSLRSSSAWFGFFTITRVVGVVSKDGSLDWDISGSGLVLGNIGDLLLISVGGLVVDDWNISGLDGGDWSVLSLVNSVVSGLFFSSVLSLVLNSVVGVEDGVVPGLLVSSVEDGVLVGVPGLWLVSVLGLRVGSLEDLDLGSVPVLFLLSVENFVVGLVGGEWNIVVVGLGVVSIDGSWLPGESSVVVGSILDFIGGGVPDLLFWSVLDLDLGELSGDWDLSGSDLGLGLGGDGVLDLVIDDFDVTESGLFAIFDVSVFPFLLSPLDGGD